MPDPPSWDPRPLAFAQGSSGDENPDPGLVSFQPATSDGPQGILGQLGKAERADIAQFVREKNNSYAREKHSNQTYSRLENGEIRILELCPGTFDSDLHGMLHIASIDFEYASVGNYKRFTNHAVSLTDNKPIWYTALSYVWGPPQFDVTFYLQDGTIQITRTLESALRHLKIEKQSIYLWIDQICINQSDTREKGQQILLMGLVYSHATNTVIWLGEESNDNPHLAFETMQDVHSRVQLVDQEITPSDFKRLSLPGVRDQAWWHIRQVFRRPWLTRVWTIQEALLSVRLIVKCGTVEVQWDDLAAWCYTLEHSGVMRWVITNTDIDTQYGVNTPTISQLPVLGSSTINTLQQERILRMTHVQRELLLNVLVSTRYAQATNPKDKVYGILGLVDSKIVPKYSPDVSAREVYHEACSTMLPDQTYRLLSCVDHESPLEPSWVPDWSVPRVTADLGFSTKSWNLYRAGGDKFDTVTGKAYLVGHVQLSDDEKEITVHGKIFDKIATLGCVTTMTSFLDIDDPKVANRELVTYADIVGAYNSYPTGATVYDAFWQTLVAGRDSSGNSVPPHEYNEVFEYRDHAIIAWPVIFSQTSERLLHTC